MLEVVQNVVPEGVRCVFIRQAEAKGLGHAVLCAEPAVGNQPFAVILPDDLIYNKGGKSFALNILCNDQNRAARLGNLLQGLPAGLRVSHQACENSPVQGSDLDPIDGDRWQQIFFCWATVVTSARPQLDRPVIRIVGRSDNHNTVMTIQPILQRRFMLIISEIN